VPLPDNLRADARRNRERILAAAEEVFTKEGPGACMAEVARRAGVGHATVFRRFPSKDALLIALLARRMADMADAADTERAVAPADEALERFMERLAMRMAVDRVLLESTLEPIAFDPALDAPRRALVDAVARLVDAAQATGRVRGDVHAEDIFVLCGAVNHGLALQDGGNAYWAGIWAGDRRAARGAPHPAGDAGAASGDAGGAVAGAARGDHRGRVGHRMTHRGGVMRESTRAANPR